VIVIDNAAFRKGKEMQKMMEDLRSYFTCNYRLINSNSIEKNGLKTKFIQRAKNCSIDEMFNTYLL
jgi:hypothetical protein